MSPVSEGQSSKVYSNNAPLSKTYPIQSPINIWLHADWIQTMGDRADTQTKLLHIASLGR